MTILKGYISEYDGQALTVIAPFEDGGILERQQIHECEIYLHDGRQIGRASCRERVCQYV